LWEGDTRAPPVSAIRRGPRVSHVSPKVVTWSEVSRRAYDSIRSANPISSNARCEEQQSVPKRGFNFLSTGRESMWLASPDQTI